MKKMVEKGDMGPLLNSRLRLFLGELNFRWSGPFKITKVQPSGATEIWNESTSAFTVNGQRLKLYRVGQPIDKANIHMLTNPEQT